MDQQFGTIKISDGLYIGDQFSSQDIDTILMNHITHIINLTHRQVTNKFESHEIVYVNFNFTEQITGGGGNMSKTTIEREKESKEIILDSLDKNISLIIEVIEETREQGESVLIHGCRSYTVGLVFFCAYLMLKYKWGLYKTIEFLESRVHKMEIGNSLIRQLRAYESRIGEKLVHPLSTGWELYPGIPLDEVTIRNTFINSFLKGDGYVKSGNVGGGRGNNHVRISWREEGQIVKSMSQTSNLKKASLRGILKTPEKFNLLNRPPSRDRKLEIQPRKSLTNTKIQSQRKSVQKQEKKYKFQPKQQPVTTPLTKHYNQSPMYKRSKEQQLKPNQFNIPIEPKTLNSKAKKENQISASQQGFATLFRNVPLQPTQEGLNKSLGNFGMDRTPLNIRFDTDNSQQNQKEMVKSKTSKDKYSFHNKENSGGREMVKESIKDEVARKLLKKMILEKGSGIAEIQNKQNITNSIKRKQPIVISRPPKSQSQTTLQKQKRPLPSQRVSQNHRQRQSSIKKPLLNNFMKQKTSQSRPESPVIKKSQTKMDVEKVRNSFQAKTQVRGQSPAASQNRISLKDASNLLNSIFPHHGFRPKWKG